MFGLFMNLKMTQDDKREKCALTRPNARSLIVGVPGIEPGLHEPESCVIPLYHTPPF